MAETKSISKAEALLKLGESRESWCAVEMKKEQAWCRKQRQHFQQQFDSSVFQDHSPGYEPRCTFEVNAPTHRERRHYADKCKYLWYLSTICLTRVRHHRLVTNPFLYNVYI
ncbi:hypothetical protein FSP39_008027 [Pinctada imbricata]|uniref:Uncharacterized protein n=1 Tax=Pinctada imbricata TaxID=66713 RepID=A0AA89BYZ7_PINIB|nr:hypothetical protein FSP39_008027 [Pinctada imbricata]